MREGSGTFAHPQRRTTALHNIMCHPLKFRCWPTSGNGDLQRAPNWRKPAYYWCSSKSKSKPYTEQLLASWSSSPSPLSLTNILTNLQLMLSLHITLHHEWRLSGWPQCFKSLNSGPIPCFLKSLGRAAGTHSAAVRSGGPTTPFRDVWNGKTLQLSGNVYDEKTL